MPGRITRIAALLTTDELRDFRRALLYWFSNSQRDLPWRRTRDPYAIWISEVMLQQTRVAAVIPYYERFIRRFPDYQALAQAPEEELLAYWSGLGYYYRARNLQKSARKMQTAGAFPRDYASIRELPGIGDYTAAAVASIGFDLPRAVLDGNALRVLSRLFADPANVASGKGRRHFGGLAHMLLDETQPGAFNQAIMELGAIICLPENPKCLVCPVSEWCRGRQAGTQRDLPVKIVPRKSIRETRILYWLEREGRILAWQRPPDSRLMPGFWELPEREQLPDIALIRKLGSFRHGITFHNFIFEVWNATLSGSQGACQWIGLSDLHSLPASTVLKKAVRLLTASHAPIATARNAAASSS